MSKTPHLIAVMAIVSASILGGIITAPITSVAVAADSHFADVPPDSMFYTNIQWMFERGLSTGTPQPSGTPLYNPQSPVSRQAMAAFLYRMSGDSFEPTGAASFADVSSSSTFYNAIEWMKASGISSGTTQPSGQPLFKPTDPVSRQAMALFLARFYHAALPTPTVPSFADVPVSSSPAAAIDWMARAQISTGTTQPTGLPTYKPLDPVSRQAMAAFLYRVGHRDWSVERLGFELVAGSTQSSAVTVLLTADLSDLTNVGIEVTGDLASRISVDTATIRPVVDGRFTVTVTASSATDDAGAFSGELTITDGGATLTDALVIDIAVTQPDASIIPESISTPAPEQITTLAGTPMTVGEIDVTIDPSVADPDASARRIASDNSGVIIGSDRALRAYQLRFAISDVVALSAFADELETDSEVVSATLALHDSISADPVNDSLWTGQWDSPGGDTWAQKMIHVDEAWQLSTGVGVDVGVIDAGFLPSHDDLKANVASSQGFGGGHLDHGTHVSGLACAAGNNNLGIAGVAYNCTLHLAPTDLTLPTTKSVMDQMAARASIINMSIGRVSTFDCHASNLTAEQLASNREAAKSREEFARVIQSHPDVLWVVSAGNGLKNSSGATINVPVNADCGTLSALGNLPNVVVVAAVNRIGQMTGYSNYGSGITVAAPGGELGDGLLSTSLNSCIDKPYGQCSSSGYETMSGTSMASPVVAGIAALAKSVNPSITAAHLKACIVDGAEAGTVQIEGQGFYLADALNTVVCATPTTQPEGGVTKTVDVGSYPRGIAIDPTTQRAVIANQDDNTVKIVQTYTGQVLHTVTVGNHPQAVAIDSELGIAYVANIFSETVSFVDINSGTVIRTIAPGEAVQEIAVDETTHRVFVSNFETNTVTAFNGSTGAILGSVAVGQRPRGIAVDPSTHRVYVVTPNDGLMPGDPPYDPLAPSLYILDGTSLTVITSVYIGVGGTRPFYVDVDHTTHAVWLSAYSGTNTTIAKVNGTTGELEGYGSGGAGSGGDVAVDQASHYVYLASGSGAVGVFDSSRNLVARVELGTGNGVDSLAVNPRTGSLWVSSYASNKIFILGQPW